MTAFKIYLKYKDQAEVFGSFLYSYFNIYHKYILYFLDISLLICKIIITIYVNIHRWYYKIRRNIIKGRYEGMLNKNLKALRKRLKLSQEEIAEKINV